MRPPRPRSMIFWALCCDLGLVAKKLILPAANLLTDSLHIPGGIGTAFSLLFLTIGAAVMPGCMCATLMGLVQSLIMLIMGRTGSMGLLAPVGYIIPGFTIDIVFRLCRRGKRDIGQACVFANCMASAAAALTANVIVFRLWGTALLLYLCVAALSGAVCGYLAEKLYRRLVRVFGNREV